jgi:hypothetical protein
VVLVSNEFAKSEFLVLMTLPTSSRRSLPAGSQSAFHERLEPKSVRQALEIAKG